MQRWRLILFAVVAGCGVAFQLLIIAVWMLQPPADLLPLIFYALGKTWLGLALMPAVRPAKLKRALAKQVLRP